MPSSSLTSSPAPAMTSPPGTPLLRHCPPAAATACSSSVPLLAIVSLLGFPPPTVASSRLPDPTSPSTPSSPSTVAASTPPSSTPSPPSLPSFPVVTSFTSRQTSTTRSSTSRPVNRTSGSSSTASATPSSPKTGTWPEVGRRRGGDTPAQRLRQTTPNRQVELLQFHGMPLQAPYPQPYCLLLTPPVTPLFPSLD